MSLNQDGITHVILVGVESELPERHVSDAFRIELEKLLPVVGKRESDIGLGASCGVDIFGIDWQTGIAGAGVGLFLLGSKIESNLEAWSKIIRRVQKGIAALREKFGNVCVAEDSAILIASAAAIDKASGIKSIRLLSKQYFDYRQREFTTLEKSSPMVAENKIEQSAAISSAYLAIFLVDEERIYVACVGCDGEIRFVSHI